MHTVILGAGVAGVTTAWYLAKQGRQVTVIDRQTLAASETSYANAGMIAPGHSYTWASPRAPGILWRSLRDDTQALRRDAQAGRGQPAAALIIQTYAALEQPAAEQQAQATDQKNRNGGDGLDTRRFRAAEEGKPESERAHACP